MYRELGYFSLYYNGYNKRSLVKTTWKIGSGLVQHNFISYLMRGSWVQARFFVHIWRQHLYFLNASWHSHVYGWLAMNRSYDHMIILQVKCSASSEVLYALCAEVSFEVQWSMFWSASKCILCCTGIALHFGMGLITLTVSSIDTMHQNPVAL